MTNPLPPEGTCASWSGETDDPPSDDPPEGERCGRLGCLAAPHDGSAMSTVVSVPECGFDRTTRLLPRETAANGAVCCAACRPRSLPLSLTPISARTWSGVSLRPRPASPAQKPESTPATAAAAAGARRDEVVPGPVWVGQPPGEADRDCDRELAVDCAASRAAHCAQSPQPLHGGGWDGSMVDFFRARDAVVSWSSCADGERTRGWVETDGCGEGCGWGTIGVPLGPRF